jgi:hypothetical protein
MHRIILALSLFLATALPGSILGTSVHAQVPKSASKSGTGETVRYFKFSDELLGDLAVDGFLREVRKGKSVASAVLDVCYSISQASVRKDRFVVALKPALGKLTGTGQSQEDKTPISVSLARKQTGETVTFEGAITRGSVKTSVSSADNVDMSEAEFRDETTEISIISEPVNFVEASPGSVAIRVKRESLMEVVKKLRKQNVQIELSTLQVDCSTLRSGQQIVHLYVDPERAPTLVNQLKKLPEVSTAGWTEGSYAIESAVLFAAAGWRLANGKLDKEKLGSAIASAAMKSLEATLDSSTWDETTGELTIKLKATNKSISGLDLTDTIKIEALVGPEKLRQNENSIVWIGNIEIDTVDEGPEPRLKLMGTNDEDLEKRYKEILIQALARDLKGRSWDFEKSAWKR